MELPFAEDIGHYWKTGISPPDTWMDKAMRVIKDLGGVVTADAYGSLESRAAFMMAFEFAGQRFKVVWPVLPSRTNNNLAAKRQAATLLYHDIKAKAMAASVLGTRVAFFSYMMLPDGRSASELANPELSGAFPLQLKRGEE